MCSENYFLGCPHNRSTKTVSVDHVEGYWYVGGEPGQVTWCPGLYKYLLSYSVTSV